MAVCQCLTNKGDRCKLKVKGNSKYCWRHQNCKTKHATTQSSKKTSKKPDKKDDWKDDWKDIDAFIAESDQLLVDWKAEQKPKPSVPKNKFDFTKDMKERLLYSGYSKLQLSPKAIILLNNKLNQLVNSLIRLAKSPGALLDIIVNFFSAKMNHPAFKDWRDYMAHWIFQELMEPEGVMFLRNFTNNQVYNYIMAAFLTIVVKDLFDDMAAVRKNTGTINNTLVRNIGQMFKGFNTMTAVNQIIAAKNRPATKHKFYVESEQMSGTDLILNLRAML